MRRTAYLCVLLWSLAAGFVAAADRPSVILITLDTVRADRMGFLGSKRGLTPQLDVLARQSVVFERAFAQAPLTPVAHASILSGTYPPFHQVHDFGNRIPPGLPYLPDLLRGSGYKTAAVVSSIILDPKNGFAPGFERGFDFYDAGFHRRQRKESRYESVERRAEVTVARAIQWLEQNGRSPFFLWVHIWDAHDPYDPPAPYKSRFAAAPYDGEIAYLDAQLGKLLAFLRSTKLFDSSLIVVLGDHGEGLGDHAEKTHGIFLYDATIHIPMLIKLPQDKMAGQRIRMRVGQVDVAPTILEAVSLPVSRAMQGQSLLRLAVASAQADRPSYAETEYSKRAFGWSALKALRIANFLYIKSPVPELYDASADPLFKLNLAEKNKAVAQRLAGQVEDFLKRVSAQASPDAQSELDPKDMEKLTALGYVASPRSAKSAPYTGADPKAKIQIANDLHDANIAIEDGRAASVIPLLERIVSSDPQIQSAQYQLGLAYARQRNFAKALVPLKKAIELLPDALMAHYEMGLALFETGDWKTAAVHFEICVNKQPGWIDARFSLASVQARTDRVPESLANLLLVVEQSPDHYRANLLLGRLLALKGQADVAVPYLEKAAQVQPDSTEAHAFLADAYERLGRGADAQRERARAEELKRPRTP